LPCLRGQRRLLRGTQALGLVKTRLAGHARGGEATPGAGPVGIFRLIERLGIGGGERKAGGQRNAADQAAVKH